MKKIIENQEKSRCYTRYSNRDNIYKRWCKRLGKVCGLKTKNGLEFFADKIIVCTGTFLNGLLYVGDKILEGGRMGELSSKELTHLLLIWD